MNKQKGSSLMIVFIICTAITILLATTFIVTSNYNKSVYNRKEQLQARVCEVTEWEKCQSYSEKELNIALGYEETQNTEN